MTATVLDLHHLERLLQSLEKHGWLPYEVMKDSAWQSSTSIPDMLQDIVKCDPPVIRMLKDGTKTALVKLAWGLGPTQLVQDHSESSGFDMAIAKARAEVEHIAPPISSIGCWPNWMQPAPRTIRNRCSTS